MIKDNGNEIKHSPKTDAGYHEIPIPNKLLTSLQKYIPKISSIYLFPQSTNIELMTQQFGNNILLN